MRTLLNEALPPYSTESAAFSPPQNIKSSQRIFSENAVLSSSEPNLMEGGVGGAVIATPGANADPANNALERGVATLCADTDQLKESPAL